VPVVIADANGVSDKATLAPAGDGTATLTGLTQDLAAPLSLYFDPLPVTRGKTVANEVLGSGDTRIAGQDFTLAKAPVTYFTDPASVSGDQFSSTVKVSVNGIAWQEARSFFGAGPTDTIFVLREDDSGKTHVQFGDGVNGARLPTGTDNVVATYRYGAGLAAPAADTLVTVLTPVPGLKGVANPVAPTGGSDADPPARIRQLAPASVLTLGRVVSLDDFAAVALATGGVSLASAQFAIDPDTQRPRTVVHVAGDGGVIAAVTAALQAAGANPSLFRVVRAQAILARLSVGYLRDPRYADADVAARLQTALTDADTGLLGANVLQIGQAIYDSRIAVTCAAVTGVRSISAIEFATVADRFVPEIVRFPGGWRPGFVSAPPVMRHDPGAGCYFSVPADRVVLTGQAGGPD
jgi:predicted phage baseplate assembly protein